ncbi:class I SAM-dependent methyltransferase [Cohnella lubricantis]|uniref:Methyltransferase domain-containing protein n=1 Tax=Cohnella lubricantis TaxID=2163172 RepID=A0A841T450_9BACL|nr:class I SAM-dependent methyltransferase [Cohnella lubricantis]MBB6676124.1 methyltransferase domain-containing protein [Cohnella lubricantis]MBP2118684.1 ubiquinone/menaquinone biosynthesis C-methylase UbiE [Cohnella lubricantis]
MAERSLQDKNGITYELFELDPAVYYQERYAHRDVVGIADKEGSAVRSSLAYQKARQLLETLRLLKREAGDRRLQVLEVGCGSGAFGSRVKRFDSHIQLFGVDMSSSCIEIAKRNGFDEAVVYDAAEGLPYGDDQFDLVYTIDFFGHIEFRSKDAIIADIHRVTKPGGLGFHGIETGAIDYWNCNPKDPNDPIRQYVYTEGHIGVEPLEDIADRFSPLFEIIQAFPFPLRPLLHIQNIRNSRHWGDEFNDAFAEIDSPKSRMAANLILGWINRYLTDQLLRAYGNQLIRTRVPKSGHQGLDRFIDTLLQGSGFSMTTVRKRMMD